MRQKQHRAAQSHEALTFEIDGHRQTEDPGVYGDPREG
jgi:hypothetical protein